MHPIEVVGSVSSRKDRRREVSRSAPASGKQNINNVRLLPIPTRARQALATTKAKNRIEITRAEERSVGRSGTRHSEKKQKLWRAGEERPLGELELDRVGKGVVAKIWV